jgi:hypothetical protein
MGALDGQPAIFSKTLKTKGYPENSKMTIDAPAGNISGREEIVLVFHPVIRILSEIKTN